MQYSDRLRFHFVEQTVRRVWHNGDAALTVIENVQQDLGRNLTQDETFDITNRVEKLCAEADKLLRSRIPHNLPSSNVSIELWGYQQIQALHPDIYIHHQQPTQADFTNNFMLPEGEVWAWNVVYTFSGPYYGIQTNENGEAATCSMDLGALDFLLKMAEVLKAFPGCEVLGDLLPENIDGFTLEADECKQIDEVLKQQQNAVANALEQIIQGENSHQAALELINTWQVPLQAAQKKGIAQFKRGKLIKSIKIG